jgi:hypothetical protein
MMENGLCFIRKFIEWQSSATMRLSLVNSPQIV